MLKILFQLSNAERRIKKIKKLEFELAQTLLDLPISAAVSPMRDQQEDRKQQEIKLMDLVSKEKFTHNIGLDQNHSIVDVSLTERLVCFRGLNLLPADVLEFSRDGRRTLG